MLVQIQSAKAISLSAVCPNRKENRSRRVFICQLLGDTALDQHVVTGTPSQPTQPTVNVEKQKLSAPDSELSLDHGHIGTIWKLL